MRTRNVIVAIVAAAGCAAPALAQDSVSKTAGLPGDAVGPYQTNVQKLDYVIDLTPLFGSWNTKFGIAPLFKTSKTSTGFFNSLQSASGISAKARLNAPPSALSYAEWFSPGQGVNPNSAINDAPGSVTAPETYTALGAVQAEFSTDDGGFNYNGVLSSVFGYEPTYPPRLFVTRYVTAVNQPAAGAADTAQFGVGSVDAFGNVAFRADGVGVADATNGITNVNLFRVRDTARNTAAINQIKNTGGTDAGATDWIDLVPPLDATRGSATQHNTPNILSQDLGGGSSHVLGSNFATNYIYENGNLVASSAAHRPGTVDHRGAVGMYPHALLGGTGEVATGAMLSQVLAGESRSMSIWGIKADGSVGTAKTLTPPLSLADSCYDFTFAPILSESNLHVSQTVFRGGNGLVALGQNVNLQRMAAFTLASSETFANPFNVIALATDDGGTPYQNVTWSLAAWNDSGNFTGKPIHGDSGNDGIPFTTDPGEFDGVVDLDENSPTYDAPIGRLASLFEVTGGSPAGPSFSAPMIDSAGNIWFLAAVALNKTSDIGPFTDYDSALVRAIYDPTDGCYRLELILELGDTFDGFNSGTRYQVQFIGGLADSNSVDSATEWSNNMVADGWNGSPVCPLRDTKSPIHLGGMTFNARIVYDVDGDGEFDAGAGVDQAYVASMYLGNTNCPADFDGSGFVDTDDYDAFVSAFELGEGTTDFDCTGFVDTDDFDAFVRAFERGC
ncbi:MAG: hypothetical protein IT435_05375 [Phycisphaerales bacterium]|nr:hypothetical protein [Phycisphaerales bacterium]